MKKLLSIMLAISLLTLSSCHTTKQAKKAINKAMKYHPELVANVCMDSFPCVTTKVDTVTNIEYDFIELKCPGYDYNNAIIDTVWLTHTKTQIVNGPAVVVTEQKINTITKQIKDSAEIKSCEFELIKLNEKCNQLTTDNNKFKNKVSNKNKLIMWLIIALLLSVIGNILQLKK